MLSYILLSLRTVSNPVVGVNESAETAYTIFKYFGLIVVGSALFFSLKF